MLLIIVGGKEKTTIFYSQICRVGIKFLSLWKTKLFLKNLAYKHNLVNLEEGNIARVIHLRFLKAYFLEYWVI